MANPELFRTSTFAIVESGVQLGLAYLAVESDVRGFTVVQKDLDSQGKVWNATPCFTHSDFRVACGRASQDAGKHSVFVSN